jgi:hypothetical protein
MADYQTLSLPSWINNHKKWDKPTIGNVVLPGVVLFKGISVQLRVEHNKAAGSDGGGSLIKGLEMPKFVFELFLSSKEDEDAWDKLAPYLLPRKDPRVRGALPVYHPTLARFQIVACIVEQLEEIPPVAGGPLTVRIHCLAVAPVKTGATKKVTPKGLGGAGPAPAYIDPNTGKTVGATTTAARQRAATPPSKKPPLR